MNIENLSQALKIGRIILSHANKKDECHIKIMPEKTEIYAQDKIKKYIATRTGAIGHNDNSFVRIIMGPYGSGKSTWAIQEIIKRACGMPSWAAGRRRRSRWGIVRNTSGELQSTTLQTWLSWFGSLGDIHKRTKPILTYEHRFNDGQGLVELELMFIALDRPEDVRKIKSLELTGCYINELSEVPKAALEHMTGRVGRYPSSEECQEPYWSGIIADTNPPDEDHWIYKNFEEQKIEGYKVYKQPPALFKVDGKWVRNPDADNINNLPTPDYYERLALGKSEEFIKVFCLGQYGTVGTGKIVYSDFNSDYHAVEDLTATQGDVIHLGFDFGLTPACVVVQLNARGQLLVLKEYCGDGIGIKSFAESVVIPALKRDFPYNKVGMVRADPAGMSRNEIVEEMSCIGELINLGLPAVPADTNKIDPRLASVRYFLNKNIGGKPCLMIDKKKCPVLYKGFVKNYVYKRVAVVGEERYKNEPDKNSASHPMDALGYICLELASDRIAVEKTAHHKPVDMWNPIARVF